MSDRLRAPRLPVLGWLLVLLFTAALSLRDWSTFQFGGWTDDAKYVLLSRVLAEGQPYLITYGPQPEPSSFPFLLPLLLTPFTILAPESLDAGKLVSLLATLVSISALFWGWKWLSGIESRWWALVAAALYGLSVQTIGMSHMIMTEPLLTMFVLLGLIASERAARASPPRKRRYLLAGFLAACAFYARSAGIALGAAMAIRVVAQKGRRSTSALASLLLGALLFVVPVIGLTSITANDLIPWLYVRNVPNAVSESGARSPLAQQVFESVQDYSFVSLRKGLVPVGGGEREQRFGDRIGAPWITPALGLAVTALVLVGALWSCSGALRPTVLLFELFYVIVILLWHVRGWRLLVPAFPILILQLVWGCRVVADLLARGVSTDAAIRRRFADVVACGAVLFLIAASLARALPRGESSLSFVRDLREGTTWLRQRTPPDAIVLAAEAPSVHIYSERPVVALQENVTSEAMWRLARQTGARYLLIGPALIWNDDRVLRYDATTAALLPEIEAAARRGGLELVYESPPEQLVRIYRFTRPPDAP